MAVTLNSGDRQVMAGTFGAVETLTPATSTTRQRISPHIPVTEINASTATSDPNETALFTVPGATATNPPVEGMFKTIKMLGTGPACFVVFESMATGHTGIPEIATATVTAPQSVWTSATATGAFVLTNKGHYIHAQFLDAEWHVIGGRATYGTGT